jgi:hypothetical protein
VCRASNENRLGWFTIKNLPRVRSFFVSLPGTYWSDTAPHQSKVRTAVAVGIPLTRSVSLLPNSGYSREGDSTSTQTSRSGEKASTVLLTLPTVSSRSRFVRDMKPLQLFCYVTWIPASGNVTDWKLPYKYKESSEVSYLISVMVCLVSTTVWLSSEIFRWCFATQRESRSLKGWRNRTWHRRSIPQPQLSIDGPLEIFVQLLPFINYWTRLQNLYLESENGSSANSGLQLSKVWFKWYRETRRK